MKTPTTGPVWGIDIGSHSVKAVQLRNMNNTPTVTGFDVVSYPGDITSKNDVDRLGQVREALAQIISRNDFKKARVFVAVPGQTAFTRTIPLPPVDPSKLDDIVKFEARQQIPFPIEEVVWDYQTIEKDDETQVAIFAIKEEIIDEFLASLTAVDIEVDLVQIAPIALYNLVSFESKITGPTVVIDVGGQNTDLVVIDGQNCWQRPLPYSGNDITKVLQQKFQIPYEEAEALKRKISSSSQADRIFKVIEPTMRDLVGEIQRSLGYYKSRAGNIKFNKLVMLGNSFRLYGLSDFVGQALKLPVEVMQKAKTIEVASTVDEAAFQNAVPTLGVAMGLGIQGCGHATININLLPSRIRKAKEIKQKQPFLWGSVAAFFFFVVLSWWNAADIAGTLDVELKDGNKFLSQINTTQAAYERDKQMGQRLKILDEYNKMSTQGGGLMLNAMDEVARNLPGLDSDMIIKVREIEIKEGDGKTHQLLMEMNLDLYVEDSNEMLTTSDRRIKRQFTSKLEGLAISASRSSPLEPGKIRPAVECNGYSNIRQIRRGEDEMIYMRTYMIKWYLGPMEKAS